MPGTNQRVSHEARLQTAGIELPQPPPAGGNYVPAVQVGSWLGPIVFFVGMIFNYQPIAWFGVISPRATENAL